VGDLVSTVTGHARLLVAGLGALVLLGGTATTISLADAATPSPSPSTTATVPAPQANPHATAGKPKKAAKADDAADDQDESSGVRPTDTHGYCVSSAVAAAHRAGKTGRDMAAAAHSCGHARKAHAHRKG
jgi:hypothetical protein